MRGGSTTLRVIISWDEGILGSKHEAFPLSIKDLFVFMYRPTMRKNQSKDRGCQTKPAKLATSMQQEQIGKGNKNRSV